ncbi:DUF4367 domain-containing protein [Paenibacillus sonchi]|uniref:DUF4367 domain-containing protein n=1 Tax=Paenibacillus sonchi TaxID=373687 RepID=A0A974P7E7_9BACL|nr:DUF4367 domain-containing protein [Paenibacillus sonchi]QQZ58740.1 DUF4367 domain-containing protein [Paenibacillus sonchi]
MKFQKIAIAMTSLALLFGFTYDTAGTAQAETYVKGKTGLYKPSKKQLAEKKELDKRVEAIRAQVRAPGEIDYVIVKNMTINLPEGFDDWSIFEYNEGIKNYDEYLKKSKALQIPRLELAEVPEGYQFTGASIYTSRPPLSSAEDKKISSQLLAEYKAAGKNFYTKRISFKNRTGVSLSYKKGKSGFFVSIVPTFTEPSNMKAKTMKKDKLTIAGQEVTYTEEGDYLRLQWDDKDAKFTHTVGSNNNGLTKEELKAIAKQLIAAQ